MSHTTGKSGFQQGRGALSNPECRYAEHSRASYDDGWYPEEEIPALKTTLLVDATRSIISHNDSPDVPFSQSINPYRGCEHGCVYCFARPTHAYLGMSPGLDFETKILTKPNAAQLLEQELSKPGYRCQTIALGTNTDPYQPAERRQRITRSILAVLQRFQHPLAIVTKSALVERDIDILAAMAQQRLVQVMVSVTSLDRRLTRLLEPRAAAPQRRLQTIERLNAAGIPTGVLLAPIIPALNEPEIETILKACAQAGARSAGYVLLRLPLEVGALFEAWLAQHYPLKASHILSQVRAMHGGKLYDASFATRMTGTGSYADMLHRRFNLATQRLGYQRRDAAVTALNCGAFSPPNRQGTLF
ncbi:MAG: PA0069 family radical SAM protein [Gammaproteobacteria bacterium]|nr:PA0069 family radical SAM protein [Gammaproteobacteria bacterium]